MTQWSVLVREEAERDIEEARDWYEHKRPGLGDDFLNAVAAGMRRLEADPEIERIYYRRFRRIILTRFPYKIFYQTIGSRVVIFRVLHAKRDHRRQIEGGQE
jgi:plasmid stabilization system protein ParE